MLSAIEKRMLGGYGSWNHKSQVLEPAASNCRHRSVIMLHGFIGSPYDLKTLGKALSQNGFRVVIPALKGQNWTAPVKSRSRYSSDQYLDFVRQLIRKETKVYGRKPFLAGFSMGGAIACIVACDNTIEKLVLIAPFFKLPHISDHIWTVTRKLAPVLPFVPKLSKGKINDPKGYKTYVPGSYLISLKAFNHLGDLAKKAGKCVGKIRVATCVLISERDRVACSKTTLNLFKDRKNTSVQVLDRANHILLYDFDSSLIINHTLSFLTDNPSS